MSEKITITYSNQIINIDFVYDLILVNHDRFITMIGNYYYAKRGKVHNLRIDKSTVVFDAEDLGNFIAKFNINFTHGCQDLTYDEDATMKIAFRVDRPNSKAEFIGEEMLEREPDEF
jgi:hypothetical protein